MCEHHLVARSKEFDPDVALATAVEVFRAKSYEAVTTAELCEAMGIGRQSLYDTFGDKASVYRAALRRYQSDNAAVVDRCLDRASALAGLQSLFDSVAGTDVDDARCGCMMVNAIGELATTDDDVANVAAGNQQWLVDVFGQAIRRGQANGEVRPDIDPRAAAAQLVGSFYGMRVMAKVEPGSDAVRAVAAHALDFLT
jgi:TetR/AcrR family transcriptional regulator, transcriptional repressor for nem operon